MGLRASILLLEILLTHRRMCLGRGLVRDLLLDVVVFGNGNWGLLLLVGLDFEAGWESLKSLA